MGFGLLELKKSLTVKKTCQIKKSLTVKKTCHMGSYKILYQFTL